MLIAPSIRTLELENGNISLNSSNSSFMNYQEAKNKNETNSNYEHSKSASRVKRVGTLEEQFEAACDAIQNLPKNGPFQPSDELLLKFYAYFKQASFGPCNTSRPSMFKVDFKERAKWDAWNSVRHLSKEQAMQGYIEEIKIIIETMPHNDFVQKLIQILGAFYEYEDEDNEALNGLVEYTSEIESTKFNRSNGIFVNGNSSYQIDPQNTNGQSMNLTHLNGNGKSYNIEIGSDDEEEDYCDTSDNISKPNEFLNQNLLVNGDKAASYKTRNSLEDKHMILSALNNFDEEIVSFNPVIIQKFGGEPTSPPHNSSFHNSQHNFPINRQSRPDSAQSINYGANRSLPLNNASGGSGGGSGGLGAENFGSNDTNRQILLQLLRLQQDINNILTRLSYLEATVLSLQSNLQMNRIENSINLNNHPSSAFSVVSTQQNRVVNNQFDPLSFVITWFKNVDWKTILVAISWPFIIRLVFYFLRKFKLVNLM